MRQCATLVTAAFGLWKTVSCAGMAAKKGDETPQIYLIKPVKYERSVSMVYKSGVLYFMGISSV